MARSAYDRLVDTVIAEAYAEGWDGMAAVAHVVENRARETGLTPEQVVAQDRQFAGYSSPGSAAKLAQQDPYARQMAESVIAAVQSGSIPDPTGGATYFHATGTPAPKINAPYTGSVAIGNQTFLSTAPTAKPATAVGQPPAGTPSLAQRSIIGQSRNPQSFTVRPGENIAGVDKRLTDVIGQAAAAYTAANPGSKVEVISGKEGRDRGTKNHPGGFAIDVQITDANGKKLGNYQNAASFRAYEQFAQTARQAQLKSYPELADTMRWGGYFGGPDKFDTMHFDITPAARGAMAMGGWESGLNANGLKGLPGAASQGMAEAGNQYAENFSPFRNATVNYGSGVAGIAKAEPVTTEAPFPVAGVAPPALAADFSAMGILGQSAPPASVDEAARPSISPPGTYASSLPAVPSGTVTSRPLGPPPSISPLGTFASSLPAIPSGIVTSRNLAALPAPPSIAPRPAPGFAPGMVANPQMGRPSLAPPTTPYAGRTPAQLDGQIDAQRQKVVDTAMHMIQAGMDPGPIMASLERAGLLSPAPAQSPAAPPSLSPITGASVSAPGAAPPAMASPLKVNTPISAAGVSGGFAPPAAANGRMPPSLSPITGASVTGGFAPTAEAYGKLPSTRTAVSNASVFSPDDLTTMTADERIANAMSPVSGASVSAPSSTPSAFGILSAMNAPMSDLAAAVDIGAPADSFGSIPTRVAIDGAFGTASTSPNAQVSATLKPPTSPITNAAISGGFAPPAQAGTALKPPTTPITGATVVGGFAPAAQAYGTLPAPRQPPSLSPPSITPRSVMTTAITGPKPVAGDELAGLPSAYSRPSASGPRPVTTTSIAPAPSSFDFAAPQAAPRGTPVNAVTVARPPTPMGVAPPMSTLAPAVASRPPVSPGMAARPPSLAPPSPAPPGGIYSAAALGSAIPGVTTAISGALPGMTSAFNSAMVQAAAAKPLGAPPSLSPMAGAPNLASVTRLSPDPLGAPKPALNPPSFGPTPMSAVPTGKPPLSPMTLSTPPSLAPAPAPALGAPPALGPSVAPPGIPAAAPMPALKPALTPPSLAAPPSLVARPSMTPAPIAMPPSLGPLPALAAAAIQQAMQSPAGKRALQSVAPGMFGPVRNSLGQFQPGSASTAATYGAGGARGGATGNPSRAAGVGYGDTGDRPGRAGQSIGYGK